MKYKKYHIKYFSFFIFAICYLLFTIPIGAQSKIRSDNYEITWPNVNMGGGTPGSTNYQLGVTTGQTAPGLYSSTGYKVRAGFQYIHSIIPFSFSISDISVDFGTLSPQTPITQQATLKVSVGGAGGYVVKVSENHPLTSTAGSTIPDTNCDNGNCSESQAQVWAQNTTYGFGFNMSGTDIPSDFINSSYFRQFADRSLGESPQTIMSGPNVGRNKQATITYKVNISPLQSAGVYQNILTFLAIPTY
ncbi:MAG: hypothetical protein ACPLKP_03315 [Microgenomates group bacterium]